MNRTAATASGACRCRTGQGHPVWLNRDPIFEAGGINLYGFVGNSPLGGIDPLGLESYVCFNVEGWAGYGHVGIITHDPSTGSYTLFEHAHGMVSEKRRQEPKGLFRGFDIAFTIPDEYDQALDDARRNFMKKPGGSTLCNNCRTSVRDIFDAAAVPKPRDYGCSPNSWLNGFWAENYGYGYVNLRAADYIRENFYPPASRADMWRYQYRLGVP